MEAKEQSDTDTQGLVGAERLLETLFPDERDRPSLRWLRSMQAKRLVPFIKMGHLVRFNPAEVRKALERDFTIHAR